MRNSDPSGLVLACRHCGFRPDPNLTQGVLKAHFEVEHDTDTVHLDLLVICGRCDDSMDFERTEGNYDIFSCAKCHRTRRITRTEGS